MNLTSTPGTVPKLDFAALAALAVASATIQQPCACSAVAPAGWQRFPPLLSLDQFETIGTLVDDPYVEPTFVEYHPGATHYDSAEAPIAPQYYPCNRCTVAACRQCGRAYLRYDEGGGYFTDARIRALQPGLLVDAA